MTTNNCTKKFRHGDVASMQNDIIINSNYDLSNMPEDILRIIFHFLNFEKVANIRLVSQKMTFNLNIYRKKNQIKSF